MNVGSKVTACVDLITDEGLILAGTPLWVRGVHAGWCTLSTSNGGSRLCYPNSNSIQSVHKRDLVETHPDYLNEPMSPLSTKDTNPKEAIGSTKLPMHLLPSGGLAWLSMAFYEGASKYGSYNWRVAGVRASTYMSACKRHLDKWFNGEDVDPKTKVHHLANAAACCLILMDAEVSQLLKDDRPPKQDLSALFDKLAEVQKHLHKMAEGLNPKHCTEIPNVE